MRYLVQTFNCKPNDIISFAIDLMYIHASKLWNVANYERTEYSKYGFDKEPDWFDRKKRLKNNEHYKMLMAQTAQDLLKDLDCSWKSYHSLLKKGHIGNTPNYKSFGQHTSIKYVHHSFKLINDLIIRFSLPSSIKNIVSDKYNKTIDYFYIKLKKKIIGIKSICFKHLLNTVSIQIGTVFFYN